MKTEDLLRYQTLDVDGSEGIAGQALARFRRALRREDQEVMDNMLAAIRGHAPAASLARHLTSIEYSLLVMVLEQRKRLRQLQRALDELGGRRP